MYYFLEVIWGIQPDSITQMGKTEFSISLSLVQSSKVVLHATLAVQTPSQPMSSQWIVFTSLDATGMVEEFVLIFMLSRVRLEGC